MKKQNGKESFFKKLVMGMFFGFLICVTVMIIYSVWSAATTRLSGHAECKSEDIGYQVFKGEDVKCWLPVVYSEEGNYTVCAMPNDIYCQGTLQDFPIMRYIVEMSK